MYDIRKCQNSKSAINYLAYDEPDIDRAFIGKGYEHLGIDLAEMDMRKFNQLIRNENPITGEQLTPRNDKDRICGWYVTFSPPKDVTLLAQFSPIGDKVREALREAGDWAMTRHLEPRVQVRDRKGGYSDRETGNVMAVRLHHSLDRPERGKVMPQEHLHYFLINATHDKDFHKGPRFAAMKVRSAFWDSMKIKLKFHKRLRDNLEILGVETAGFGMKWRVPGIDRATIDRFSIRRDAARKNNEMGVPRAFSGLVGRSPKQPVEDIEALKSEWEKMLSPRDLACLRNITPRPKWGRKLHPGKERMNLLRFLHLQGPEKPGKESDRGISIS